MDGTRKYVWWTRAEESARVFLCAHAKPTRGDGWAFASLNLAVEQIDELPQPAEAAAVEAEAQPRQLRQVRLVRLDRVGSRQHEGAARQDVLELRADPL